MAGLLGCLSVLIVSRHKPVRGWLSDVVRILGHVRVVTSGESEALRAVQMLRVDLAIIDCFGLLEDEHAALIASLESLSAEQPLPVISIVGPSWRLYQGEEGVNPSCEAIHLPWPIALESLKRAVAESQRRRPDDCRSMFPPQA